MFRLFIIRAICSLFPPIVSQSVRDFLISIKTGESMNLPFKRRSFTGSVFFGNTSDFHAFKFMIHGYFDWRNVILARSILKFKKGDIIEVGANIGTETIGFADVNTHGNVIAFEPLPVNFEILETIKEKNQLDNLKLYPNLVSEKEGEAHFNIPPKTSSGAGHIAKEDTLNTSVFKVVTLDGILKNHTNIALIVADVEGYESQVLKGASSIISQSSPFLVLEVNERFLKERAEISLLDFYNQICDDDYSCFYINRFGLKKVDASNFESKKNKNWLCIPNKYLNQYTSIQFSLKANAWNPFISFFKF